MKILVLGAGGIGGYFGGRLAEAGKDVTFLVRNHRKAILEREGLRIASPFGDAHLQVKTVDQVNPAESYDLILLTCKAYDLADAIESITPAVGNNAVVLPLLNGIAHIEKIQAALGTKHLIAGIAKIQSTVETDGTVRQFNDWRYLTVGELDGSMTDRLAAIQALFTQVKGVEIEAVNDIRRRMWEKLVHLSTAAGITCLMRANIGEIARTIFGRAQVIELLESISTIAALAGYPMTSEFLQNYREIFTDPESAYSTSMLRDIERGGKTEGEHILGYVLREAITYGINCSTLALAYTNVRAHEERRLTNRA
ncbi:TPA: 2-dehydropantoate 2-reductase [Pseudomonas aeruginosa]|nr:2-dehydropantoate 2-reductase [Pseudomonas aeruginosa]MBG4125820.1 2-dehydropantoate 2-reductase [Pseudomonas aeruginosa]HEP9215067.1 2-dehydropantoate 2-reductase [Pseudomonas aeruginosa]HEP9244505.1 2-dehydropantoate 2-reductase [Pseudomonas aeruginosa]